MTREDPSGEIARLAALSEPVRRALYLYVAGGPGDVSREEAAGAVGVSRALAAFHLDKLVGAGLLDARYRRLSSQRGPGAGRPSKLYRRSATEIEISIPPRDYRLAARLALRALQEAGSRGSDARLRRTARAYGVSLGEEARRRAGKPSRRRLLANLESVLREQGFQPDDSGDGEIRLLNCPFDALVAEHRDAVCGMNLALMNGVLEGLGRSGLEAFADRQPGMCCVMFRRTSPD